MGNHRRAPLAILAVLAVLATGAKCEFTSTPAPATSASGTNNGATGVDARQQLAGLPVAVSGSMAGYSRDRFPLWNKQGDGCNTRDRVLQRDGRDVKTTADCKIVGGTWVSPYDNKTLTDPQLVDIDHMVPLANAWRSGASAWTDDKRSQFANDLTRPQLLAVSASANRAKGDQDPSQWKPTNRDYWCQYAQRWVAVKVFWQLTVTVLEKAALGDMLGACT
jgi:hypothetical protein